LLYPEAFPNPVGPIRPSAGWLARTVAAGQVEVTGPEPRYLRRPDAVAPGAPKRVS
jgi:tRNA threonylcarbamoyladenosine biosynthesis protein TsaB